MSSARRVAELRAVARQRQEALEATGTMPPDDRDLDELRRAAAALFAGGAAVDDVARRLGIAADLAREWQQ